MRITALEGYGLRCLLVIAKEGPGAQLSIGQIAKMEGLSIPYTSKLLAILRKAELVVAERGRSGGFSITRDPKNINLYDVITALGGPIINPDHCKKFTGQKDTCVHKDNCSVHDIFGGLAGYIQLFLSGTTVHDLINKPDRTQPEIISPNNLLIDKRSSGAILQEEILKDQK